ncbi:MAG TPA: hypothetical protein VH088_14140 [Terriglobales bacterium]|nr:hypothetical protein [Terriglobales bacterium]
MRNKTLGYGVRAVAVLVLVSGIGALAQTPASTHSHFAAAHFRGIINDYSPSTVAGGPYEIRGNWSLNMRGGAANFSAEVTMETSDSGVTVDLTDPNSRGAHTHHITMANATVNYTSDPTVCPAYNPATTSPNLVINGTVHITGNGNAAPFELKGPSTLQVCINGGTVVPFSNVSLVLKGPATGHFGTEAIHGVVRKVE